MNKLLFTFGIFFCFSISCKTIAQGNLFESTVRIYAHTVSGKVKGGTGFVIRRNNHNYIATCYHIINQSKSIDIFSIALKKSYECHIVAYDSVKDIALLDGSFTSLLQPLLMGNIPSSLYTLNGFAIGNPDSNNEFILKMRFTAQNGIVSSTSLTDNNGHFIFKSNNSAYSFNVIPFDATIYGGMSGAPIIVNSQVIGLVSGSINTGGTIGWGIPSSYINDLTIVNPLLNGLTLPDLISLSSNNYNLIRSLIFDENSKDDFEPLQDVTEKMNENFNTMSVYVNLENQIINNFRILTTNINLNLDQESLNDLAHSLRLTVDSINACGAYVTTATESFSSSRQTFDEVFKTIKDNYDEDKKAEIDTLLGNKIIADLSSFDNREQINKIKYSNKAGEWLNANRNIPQSIFYNDQNVLNDVNQWLASFLILKEYNITLINYFKILNSEYKLLKSYSDLLYESMVYKSDD